MANKSQDLKDFCAYWANYGLTGSDWEFDFDTLEVGFAREDITPDYQVILVGGSQRVTSEALDEITLTCVALNEGDETYLIYTADLLLADDSRYVAAAKRAVEAATGVPRANIIINTTHTHSSVGIGIDSWTYTDENGAVVDITENLYRFREDFYAAATTAAQKAIADLTTVTAAYAGSVADDRTKHDGIAFVRHYIKTDGNPDYSNNGGYDSADDMFEAWYSCKYKNHAAFADEEIQLAKFERADGKKNVVLISVPVHGTLNENSKKISADFPYYIRQTVEAEGESLLAYFIGAAGDQVPRSKLCSYHLDGVPNNTDYEVYGKKLGNLALGVLDNLTQLESTALKATKAVYEGEVNDYRFDYINSDPDFFNKTSEQLLAETKYKFNDAYDIAYTKHRYEYVQKHGLGMDMNIQTMAIGELGFVFAPYEMSGVNGMWIKDNSPYKNTFMVTCSDDTVSYVASQIAFDNWSYEASCTWFKPGAGEGLAEKFVETLGQQINS